MDQQTLYRPDLGHVVSHGDLYDCRTDSFIRKSIFEQIPKDATTDLYPDYSKTKILENHTFTDNCQDLDVNPELAVSIISGLSTVSGSGLYPLHNTSSTNCLQKSIMKEIHTRHTRLELSRPQLIEKVNQSGLMNGTATHIVAGVTWGARLIVTLSNKTSENTDLSKIERCLHLKELTRILQASTDISNEHSITNCKNANLRVHCFDDLHDKRHLTVSEAANMLKEFSQNIGKTSNGKGKPFFYELIPISRLKKQIDSQINEDINLRNLPDCTIRKLMHRYEV